MIHDDDDDDDDDEFRVIRGYILKLQASTCRTLQTRHRPVRKKSVHIAESNSEPTIGVGSNVSRVPNKVACPVAPVGSSILHS